MTTYAKLQTRLIADPKMWLITGVAGFIGSNLLETLLMLNQRVVGLDNLSTGHQQLKEWALLDTFDWLAPAYDNPQTIQTVRRWFDEAKFEDVHVSHVGQLVARGTKSI